MPDWGPAARSFLPGANRRVEAITYLRREPTARRAIARPALTFSRPRNRGRRPCIAHDRRTAEVHAFNLERRTVSSTPHVGSSQLVDQIADGSPGVRLRDVVARAEQKLRHPYGAKAVDCREVPVQLLEGLHRLGGLS